MTLPDVTNHNVETVEDKLSNKQNQRKTETDQRRSDRRFEALQAGRADITTAGEAAGGPAGGGIPGVSSYNGIDHMPSNIRTHRKTFLFDLYARDFVTASLATLPANNPIKSVGLVAPYYQFPWQYLFWYLDAMELGFYRRCNFSKVKESRYRINIVGFRTPFTTNNTSSSVANSMVDMRADFFKGIERIHPFRAVATPDGKSILAELNTVGKLADFYTGQLKQGTDGTEITAFGTNLYGLSVYNTAIGSQITGMGANQKSVPYLLQPMFTRSNYPTHGVEYEGFNNLHVGWPAFANVKTCSMDLKQFNGPVTEVVYRPKNGIINMTASVLAGSTVSTDTLTAQYVTVVRKAIASAKLGEESDIAVPGAQQISEMEHHLNFGYKPSTSFYSIQPKENQPNGSSNEFHANAATVEGPFYNSGHEFNPNTFESIMLGIRPTYNGSSIQEGILSIEVETEIDIEYQLNWPNQSEWTKNSTAAAQKYSLLSNTNDQDLMFYSGQQTLPSYTAGGKQIQHIVNGYSS